MTTASTCPACGSDLPADSPEGLCPDCLLSAGLGEAVDPKVAQPGKITTPMPGLFVPPSPESLAAHFPQLEILESLGHGGMGAVYKARQSKLDRMVALKILRPESADDPAFAERFNREARTLARLHHPNVVAIHDFGEVDMSDAGEGEPQRLYYFVMEYVDGASLRDLIREDKLRPDQCFSIVSQICDALQYAHDEHVVHRDIKPENILVDSRGRVKIADFGLAKLAARSRDDYTLTGTHQVMGTPRYMAPEQMEGSHLVDHRADIYSLGVVLYEMLTGQIPAGHFEPPSRKRRVDARIDQVVLRSMARDPHRRYQSVSDLKADVATIAGSSVMNSYEQVAPAVAHVADGPMGHYMSEYDQEMLLLDVRIPAGGLMLVGALSAAFWIVMGFFFVFEARPGTGEFFAGVNGSIVGALAGIFVIYSAVRLRDLQNYELAFASSILVLLPWSPAVLMGIPVGVMTIRTLTRPDIKAAFVRVSLQKRGLTDVAVPMPARPTPNPPGSVAGRGHSSHGSLHPSTMTPAPFPGPSTMLEKGVGKLEKLLRRRS